MNDKQVISALRAAWEREIEAARLYNVLAEQQSDEKKARILHRLASIEEDHARQFADRILALGGIPPQDSTTPTTAQKLLARSLGTEAMLRRIEAEETRNVTQFGRHAAALESDPESHQLFLKIEEEEKQHTIMLQNLKTGDGPKSRLEAMMKGEKHASTGSWIGDAIYGLNDGLGAVFGVVSGMAGATAAAPDGMKVVLTSGLIATLASALSMGTSAFMAAKSEREVYEAEIAREKLEIEQSPEHEIEELNLIYQLKGFSESEATTLTQRMAANPDQFLKTMAQEELGLSEHNFPNPVLGAFTAASSTAVGGMIPTLPFFFTKGMPAVLAAAAVGMAAHFAVGAAKSLVTARSWWSSGLEMTMIGFICGGVTYVLGLLLKIG